MLCTLNVTSTFLGDLTLHKEKGRTSKEVGIAQSPSKDL